MPLPIISQPIISQPILSQPIISQPIISHPIISQPIISQPILSQPIVSQPILSGCGGISCYPAAFQSQIYNYLPSGLVIPSIPQTSLFSNFNSLLLFAQMNGFHGSLSPFSQGCTPFFGYQPVCGINNVTYLNLASAACQGLRVRGFGPCF